MTDEELEAQWKATHPIQSTEVPTEEEVRDPAFLAWYSAACDIEPTAANMIELRASMPSGRAFRCVMEGLENRVPFWAVSPGWVARNGERWLDENRELVRMTYHGVAPWDYPWPLGTADPRFEARRRYPPLQGAELEAARRAWWKGHNYTWEPTFV